MKRYKSSFKSDFKKQQLSQWKREHTAGGFRCSHCRQFIVINNIMGTINRNHCYHCLWSKHVDETKGDRRATCDGGMKPVGLTFKHEGYNKIGEIMLIHLCSTCQKISINRIARDDTESAILEVFEQSLTLGGPIQNRLLNNSIDPLKQVNRYEVMTQLFGSRHTC